MNTEKKTIFVILIFASVFEIILGLQGFDLCDEGFTLSFYQQFFNNPATVQTQFVLWFSGFIGGIWNLVFGFGGIVSFRLLAVICILLTIYFSFKSLSIRTNYWIFPIATTLILLSRTYGIMVFDHNDLTALLITISCYFLLQGLQKENPLQLLVAFFFCGINIFSRLPNITMVVLGILLVINYCYTKDRNLLKKYTFHSFLGFASGIMIVFIIMLVLGHLEYFTQSVKDLLITGSDNNDRHNMFALIWVSLQQIKELLFYGVIFMMTVSVLLIRKFAYQWLKIFFIAIGLFVFYHYLLKDFNNLKFYGIITVPILTSIYFDIQNKNIILLNTTALLVMFLLPFGSDGYIVNMGYYTAFLGTFVAVYHFFRFANCQVQQDKISMIYVFSFFFLLFCINGLKKVAFSSYFDEGNRFYKTYYGKNRYFTVATSKEKVKEIDILLAQLNKYVKPNDFLFCYASLPMINYLTATKPYLDSSWAWIYGDENFKFQLQRAQNQHSLPVVLMQKCQPIYGNWLQPDHHNKYVDNNLYKKNHQLTFDNFLIQNQYRIIWENTLFRIYLPHKKKE